MRNTLIFTDQIRQNQEHGMAIREAIVEATVRRARPVILDRAGGGTGVYSADACRCSGRPWPYVLIGGVLVGPC